jgi:hypothetical protein
MLNAISTLIGICMRKYILRFLPEFFFVLLTGTNKFSQQFLILLFGSVQASAEKPGVLNLFLSHFFFMLSSKRGFQNSGSNPT